MRSALLFISLLLVCSCQRRQQVYIASPNIVDTTLDSNSEVDERLSKEEQLRRLLINQVSIDSLIKTIAPQDKVKLIAKLLPQQNNYGQTLKDDSNHYVFNLSLQHNRNGESNTIITYKEHKIDFSQYKVSCYRGENCGFGYNFDNTINNADVIEVCGMKFLYASISHNCVGKGCGVELTLIYDLHTYTPTFIQTYHVSFGGYYLSDFDSDGNPDLLLAECEQDGVNTSFGVDEFTYVLTAYTYQHGKFIPLLYNHDKPASVTLYGFGDYERNIASITESNWFK